MTCGCPQSDGYGIGAADEQGAGRTNVKTEGAWRQRQNTIQAQNSKAIKT